MSKVLDQVWIKAKERSPKIHWKVITFCDTLEARLWLVKSAGFQRDQADDFK